MTMRKSPKICRWERRACTAALMVAVMLLSACGKPHAQTVAGESFVNPLLASGGDPWVTRYDGYYYYTQTLNDRIALWKTRDMARLAEVSPVVVWRAPSHGPNSTSIWAPELHRINGKWYLYYTAAEKGHDDDAHRHIFVLENDSPDPTHGTWTDKGMVNTHYNGIDATVFRWNRQWYFVYSAYVDDHSDLVIASMRNPWTLSDRQVDIAHPTQPWEMYGGRKIMEAPEFLAGPDDKLFLVYSASACWSDHYALGMLTAQKNADLTNPASWTKSPRPVFAQARDRGVYATRSEEQ